MKRLYSVSSILLLLILTLCLTYSNQSSAQTSALSFIQIPFSDPDLNRPGGGAEQWNDQNLTTLPIAGTNTRRLDKYFRFSWTMFEVGQGNYTWTKFDQEINDAISKGQKFGFGIMTHYPDAVSPHRLNFDGGYAVYPLYLHQLMQAEPVKDWRASNGAWVPNWNSEAYITRLLALHQAINNHINTTSYNGVAYKNVINYVDVRGYGAFGEWHSYTIANVMSDYPAGTRATTASLNRIIDAHVQGFPDFPLVILVSTFDGNRLGNTMNPPEVAYHALTRRNNWGLLGWRRDNWGATDAYIRSYTDQNTITVNGMRLDTAIMNRYKYAPVNGEPCCNANYSDLETQVRRYHAVSFGNGNFSASSTVDPNVRAASKAAGYRLVMEGGSLLSIITTGSSFPMTLQWKNNGVSPTYEDWDVVYELKNILGAVVWTGTSSFRPKLFLPQTTATSVTDNLTVPTSVPAGAYTMTLKVRDADGFRAPMPLAINGRNSDGSYTLGLVTVLTGSSSGNISPVANAGSNQTITLPASSATLNGNASSDADGTISTYAWSQVNGPSTSSFSATSTSSVTVSNLQAGTYTYRLTVTDNDGATGTTTVTVTVNAAANQGPTANAGPNQTITLPTSSAILNGTGSSDADGTISTYQWQQISGPSSSSLSSTSLATITVSNLQAGTYNYRLTVTDNDGATATDNVTITVNGVNNQAPTANAGANQTITLPTSSAILNGTGSSDADGTISTYQWQQISGPSTSSLSSTSLATITVSNLQAGTYNYRLTVTDNDGATATDNVTITVNGVNNQTPTANAGANQTITLPTSSVILNGSGSSDADGTISTYQWQQISGPSTSSLSSTSLATITVTNLQAGSYSFRLTVTDNDGATATDNVNITVNAAPNLAPTANAGPNQSITLPASSAILNGAASSDPDGVISSYLWQQVSGPSTSSFSSTSQASITVSNLQQGVYTYRLTVRDNDNATATDLVTVTVNGAANQAPTANAGPNQTITLPVSSVSLIGTASADADGTISSYEWDQLTGPATANLSSTTNATVTASALQAGTYTFQLTVTDNDGATSNDIVTITVNSPSNQTPLANAGTNRVITLPTSSVGLNGSGSSDPDGIIASYLWQQVSGPSTSSFSSTSTAVITVSNLQLGIYTYRLTVRDNNNTTATDLVTVTVLAAPNLAPIADAGPNRVITLPTNTTTLVGTGSSDPDGTISSYQWQQTAGPAGPTFSSTSIASITVGNLQQGVYTFRLTVRDNDNAVSSDLVTVTVNSIPNELPVAVAGNDKVVDMVTANSILDGSASYDPDGTIASFQWRQISGPGATTFASATRDSSVISNLVMGNYVYVLTVRDNRGGTDNDTIRVAVVDNFRNLGQTIALYPNPATDVINLRILTLRAGEIKINVYDMTGRKAMRPTSISKPDGPYTVVLDISTLRSGSYVLETILVDQKKKLTTKFIKK